MVVTVVVIVDCYLLLVSIIVNTPHDVNYNIKNNYEGKKTLLISNT